MATTTRRKPYHCKCGKPMSMYASECNACDELRRERRDKQKLADRAIVAAGKCPLCGRALRRNLSLAGWWQCSQLGAVGFRAEPHNPPCEWQTFTE